MYVIMDKHKKKKNQDQKITLEQTYILVVWTLFCALSATKWGETNINKIKKKSKEILCKIAHTSEQFYSLKKINIYVNTFFITFFQVINLCKKRKFTQFKKSTSAV